MLLPRSLCNTKIDRHLGEISLIFMNGIREIREYEKMVAVHSDFFQNNIEEVKRGVDAILEAIK